MAYLDLARNLGPFNAKKTGMAIIAKAMNPKIEEPHPTGYFSDPTFLNKASPNNGKQPAMTDLNKALLAKTEAKYL